MRAAVRPWSHWLGERVHPLRLAIESLCTTWALWPLSVLVYVFFARMFYPIDLEWCEGGALYEAYRLIHGLPLYSRVDPAWAPLPYPPAHTALLALVGVLHLDFGLGDVYLSPFLGCCARHSFVNFIDISIEAALQLRLAHLPSLQLPAAIR